MILLSYKETEWIRASLADLAIFGCGPWNAQKVTKKEKEEGCFRRGVHTHMLNALLSLTLIVIILVFFGSHSLSSFWSAFCIMFSQLGLIYDNLVNALGKYIGEGQNLCLLSKVQFLFHAVGIPLLAIPVTEVGVSQGVVLGADTQFIMTSVALFWAAFELFRWLSYDKKDLKLVDLRCCKGHKAPYLAGTLAYTSGKFLELVLPCILLIFYELTVGCCILWNDLKPSLIGLFLTTSALTTLLFSTIPGGPDIQLYGENFHGCMIAAILKLALSSKPYHAPLKANDVAGKVVTLRTFEKPSYL